MLSAESCIRLEYLGNLLRCVEGYIVSRRQSRKCDNNKQHIYIYRYIRAVDVRVSCCFGRAELL
jgi:hypothetical protein